MTNIKKPKRAVGGSAAERGLDFQARIGGIVMAHILAERPLGWLEGVLDDTPLELDAETGGPGDDICFLTIGGRRVELQAKRGLQRGDDLWQTLLSLAEGVSTRLIDAGVLAVCPNSSGSIRAALSEDIVRVGTGRFDGLREISSDFSSRLTTASFDPSFVCSRIRIVVVSAVDGNREAESTAGERLSRVVHDPQLAWKVVVEYSRHLIRIRGKSTPDQLYRGLSLAGAAFKMRDIETHAQLQAAIRKLLHDTYSQITILGVNGKVSFNECWLSLDTLLLENGPTAQEELDKALKQYHDYSYRHRASEKKYDSHTTARCVNKCIVMGGPGIGKSTLLKKLALEYSSDGFLTLLVRLPQVVALIREGRRLEDSLVESALSGSGIRAPLISLDGAVVLCDGLDECGSQQPLVTLALHTFSVAHPKTRIVVTSRPIGYRPGELAGWRHYELQPLEDTEAGKSLLRVLQAIPFPNESLRDRAIALAMEQLQIQSIKGTASRSPLMLTLIAALSAKGIEPGIGKAALYRQLFQLIEDHPPIRLVSHPPSEPERSRFLELLGWSLLAYGNEPADQTLKRCAKWWSEEMEISSFASEVRIQACCDYWEYLGIIERVRTLTQEAITFVHKTFGEFAAARYIARCDEEYQRMLIARAIQIPEWKETLSFASHLGSASLILDVWAELVEAGDSRAGYSLDSAMEFVVQSGVSITTRKIEDFTACCWKVLGNATSRSRYAAGEALCIVSKSHWPTVRLDALNRLGDTDSWIKIVAWACLSVSPEQNIPFSELITFMQGLNDLIPRDSYLGGIRLGQPTSKPVYQHLLLSAVKRILARDPDQAVVEMLKDLSRSNWMTVRAFNDLQAIFREFGIDLPLNPENDWKRNIELLATPTNIWNREAVYLLELIDDAHLNALGCPDEDPSRFWELGALLTASDFWQMPIGEMSHISSNLDMTPLRHMVIDGIARAANLNKQKLAQQAKTYCRHIADGKLREPMAFFDLPRVDADTQLEAAVIEAGKINELERLILGNGEFFPLNAGKLLYGLRDYPEYIKTVKRLLASGNGEAIRISAILAASLPEDAGQTLLLESICDNKITTSCCYLYEHLKPPFNARHVHAMQLGLEGNIAQVAKAAADLAAKIPLTVELADQLRLYFDQWVTKEKPYPKKGGTVPDSPRDVLAKILGAFFVDDHEFLIRLAKDDRPNVSNAAQEPILRAAATSSQLRKRLLEETELDTLNPALLRAAISAGLYTNAEAFQVSLLLQSNIAHVRFAALPILDKKYLSAELVCTESTRLLCDGDMDIREAAGRALRKLDQIAPDI